MADSNPTSPAQIDWDSNGQPLSTSFGDVYFSKQDGIAETRYVFVQQNHLIERWANLNEHNHFVIAETGFGTGLNFLATWAEWQAHKPQGAQLHFISVEKYPLKKSDLSKALDLWPELQPYSTQLLAQYPPIDCSGFHRIHFSDVSLTLIFADAQTGFQELLCQAEVGQKLRECKAGWSPHYRGNELVDAWFLDGFAPSKNPQMWSDNLFQIFAKLSRPNATYATFTCAAIVKKGLQNAGFTLEKVKGYGKKREMLRGNFVEPPKQSATKPKGPKVSPSWHCVAARKPRACAEVTIIGAGLAGAHTAHALAQRGIKVTVIEQNTIAAGASGNPMGVVYNKLSHETGVLASLNLTAFIYALRFYHQHEMFNKYGNACGVLQLVKETDLPQAQAIANSFCHSKELVYLMDRATASTAAKIKLSCGGLFFPNSGWLAPKKVCSAQLAHANIRLIENQPIKHLNFTENHWQLIADDGSIIQTTSNVVLANANQAKDLAQTQHLPGKSIRGQVSLAEQTTHSEFLQTVICSENYIAPAQNDFHCMGATYNLTSNSSALCATDHQQNINNIQTLSPDFSDLFISQLQHGRVSFRSTTPDYLPLVGPAPMLDQNIEKFAAYRRNRKQTIDTAGSYYPGLYVNYGHGSRGLTYTPISAEILACMLTGAPLPIARSLMLHLHPMRFLIRDLARNRL